MGIDINTISQIGRAIAVGERNENNRKHPGSRDAHHETWAETNRKAAQNTIALIVLIGVLTCAAKLLVLCGRASLKMFGRKLGLTFNWTIIGLFISMIGAHVYDMLTFSGGTGIRDFSAKMLLILILFWMCAGAIKLTQNTWRLARGRFGKVISVILNAPMFVLDVVVVVVFFALSAGVFVGGPETENQGIRQQVIDEKDDDGFEHVRCATEESVCKQKSGSEDDNQQNEDETFGFGAGTAKGEFVEESDLRRLNGKTVGDARTSASGIRRTGEMTQVKSCDELKQREMVRVAEVAEGFLRQLNRHASAVDPDYEAIHKIEYARDHMGPAGVVCIGMSPEEANIRLIDAANRAIQEMEKSFREAKSADNGKE